MDDPSVVPLVFGYEKMSAEDWKLVRSQITTNMDDDIERRADSIILIKETLASLFRDNPDSSIETQESL